MENHPGGGVMRAPKERFDFVHEFLSRVFGDALHAKRILSLTNGTLGVMTGAALAVSLIGQASRWFAPVDARIFYELLTFQNENNIDGGVAEIGVHYGKSFCCSLPGVGPKSGGIWNRYI